MSSSSSLPNKKPFRSEILTIPRITLEEIPEGLRQLMVEVNNVRYCCEKQELTIVTPEDGSSSPDDPAASLVAAHASASGGGGDGQGGETAAPQVLADQSVQNTIVSADPSEKDKLLDLLRKRDKKNKNGGAADVVNMVNVDRALLINSANSKIKIVGNLASSHAPRSTNSDAPNEPSSSNGINLVNIDKDFMSEYQGGGSGGVTIIQNVPLIIINHTCCDPENCKLKENVPLAASTAADADDQPSNGEEAPLEETDNNPDAAAEEAENHDEFNQDGPLSVDQQPTKSGSSTDSLSAYLGNKYHVSNIETIDNHGFEAESRVNLDPSASFEIASVDVVEENDDDGNKHENDPLDNLNSDSNAIRVTSYLNTETERVYDASGDDSTATTTQEDEMYEEPSALKTLSINVNQDDYGIEDETGAFSHLESNVGRETTITQEEHASVEHILKEDVKVRKNDYFEHQSVVKRQIVCNEEDENVANKSARTMSVHMGASRETKRSRHDENDDSRTSEFEKVTKNKKSFDKPDRKPIWVLTRVTKHITRTIRREPVRS